MIHRLFITTSICLVILTSMASAQGNSQPPVKSEQPETKQSENGNASTQKPVKVVRKHGCGPGSPTLSGLDAMVLVSDVIVVGKVSKVSKVCTTPRDVEPLGKVWLFNNTIYAIEVERFLKGTGPQTLKVNYMGGEVQGVRFIMQDVPHPEVGQRYLLFLRRTADHIPAARKRGYFIYGVDGKEYRSGDLDEHKLVASDCQVLLKKGWTSVVSDAHHPDVKIWQFRQPDARQIVGVREKDAIAAIEDEVVKLKKRKKL